MLYIFDLDGTLANDSHRQHHLDKAPPDWEAFFAECPNDEPVRPLFRLMNLLLRQQPEVEVEIWTGRSRAYFDVTVEWLQKYMASSCRILMRAEGDFRRSTIVKGGWLEEKFSQGIKPADIYVFEDRAKDAQWWREQGVTCLQVADNPW